MKGFLSLFLSVAMIFGLVPVSAYADTVSGGNKKNITATITAQADGKFLCAPQIGVSVSSDTAEKYGFQDSVADGVSALDALVKLHEVTYGGSFTEVNASDYLAADEYGYISKLFTVETTANGFVHNGAYPNDGTESDWGGYNGTTVSTQELSDGDTVEFFIYQDMVGWSDELSWFNYKGKAVTEIISAPKAALNINLKTSSYMMAYQYIDADAIHAVGSGVFGAQLAWVDNETGTLTNIPSAVTDAGGNVSITAPETEGTYYLTAYIPDKAEGEPLIMSLTKIIVSGDAPQADPCALSALAIASFDSNPDALELTPEFSRNVYEYYAPVVAFPSMDIGVFRSVYVKAAAESDEAVITAECNGICTNITSGDSMWKMLNGALIGGKNNVLKITVAKSNSENAEKKTYSITIPMKPKTNTAPEAIKETEAVGITVGDTYSVDLSEVFTDADEVDTLTYKVSVNDAEAVFAEKNFTLTPNKTGVYKLSFTANDGTADSNSYTVTLTVNGKYDVSAESAKILTASTDSGDWYPCAFNKDKYTYCIVVPEDITETTLTYTVSEGASVKLGANEQTADNGVYTLPLETSLKTLTITSDNGSSTYSFMIQKKVGNYPDKVVDYLCVNSQYTNGVGFASAAAPWVSLSGDYTSLGNFGGYITYYYEDALTDNPNNKYGIDFYVYGNANKDISTTTKTAFFEPAQAWVSEDGEIWYALAGSAHYDQGVDWNYSVTYSKTARGKTAWTDSHGNIHDGASYSGEYPLASVYGMNELASSDAITLSGIALPARDGNIAVVGAAADAYPVKWGYADCFANGTIGADVNPYSDNTDFDLQTNGFDLKWAVDENGNPVDVSNKEFHYVKLVTASNIWHLSSGEKSPEIAGVVKTAAQGEAVGKTAAPLGVTITDGADSKVINFNEEQQIYSVDVGDMKYVSLSVNGAAETDNIYINNNRIAYDDSCCGFKITKESGARLVRIIVQNGEKEPVIYLLKITGSATETNDLIEGVKLDVNGSTRAGITKDGRLYTASVGYRISSVGIFPVADNSVSVTINGEAVKDKYELLAGENIFTITGERDGTTHSVTLKITKESVPVSGGKITVYFTLLGDTAHGESNQTHTLKKGGLEIWIERTGVKVDSPATVLDVLEKALEGKYTFVNNGGNYISEINGLAEFANGPLSGWMYTLNGSYFVKDIAEQTVENGDKIVFHYTDDYTKEEEKIISSGGSSITSYTVSFETNGGGTIKSQSIDENGTVTEPAKPSKDGCTFAGWFTDKELTKKYDFSARVTKGFTLYAKWIDDGNEPVSNKDHKLVFADVEENAWYEEAVLYAVENNLLTGISDTEFAPDEGMTRAMLVTVLYRLENPEEKERTHSFADVTDGEWYEEAVAWASESGIVNGVSETEFAPNDHITREQIACIIYRYAKMKGYGAEKFSELSDYTDVNEISGYALDGIRWANAAGLINGVSKRCISPKTTATRAQAAAILMNFCESVAK